MKLRYIMYCRKSTDAEDRQVQSITDQKRESDKLAREKGIKIVKFFGESKSAKQPGRPMFNEMIQMIQNGEAEGILCWKLNRLARNPIDGGQIQWLLQQGTIQSIITPSREYLPTDNVLMMTVELGMANQFILDLSKDVKRGMKAKAEKGWRPHTAPLGYLNDKSGEKGNKKIFKDPERFPLVRKMWDSMLTGNYAVPWVRETANEEWGLKTVPHKKKGGKKLSLSVAYKIFTNRFYYGEFTYNGEVYQGKHEPMITKGEYDRVQRILGRAGKPRPKTKRLPFNGIIRCGECGAMITSEQKFKKIKSTGEIRNYIYHHCTKRKKDTICHQKSISHKELKKQIEGYLDSITIPEEFLDWALEVLNHRNELEKTDRNLILQTQQKNYQDCIKRIDNLIQLYISPDNIGRELLSEQEFKEQKNALIKEKTRIESEMKTVGERVNEWVDLSEKTFKFATYAKHWFEKGDFEVKTSILRALGQNFTLKDGILAMDLKKPYLVIKEGLEIEPVKNEGLELAKTMIKQPLRAALPNIQDKILQWSCIVRQVSTYFQNNTDYIYIPDFS